MLMSLIPNALRGINDKINTIRDLIMNQNIFCPSPTNLAFCFSALCVPGGPGSDKRNASPYSYGCRDVVKTRLKLLTTVVKHLGLG
jgi:hypothetical protein